MTATKRTLKQLAQDVTITATRRKPTAAESREYERDENARAQRSGGTIRYPDDRRYFTVTLGYRGRRMVVPFHQGSAWSTDPTAEDVLDCVALDASGYDNARTFEEWAAEYGYDTDSRAAEKTYRQVAKQTVQLKALLGGEYRAFIEAEHD